MAFVQYLFCPICKVSHKQKRKHVYCKRHQTIVMNMLNKYLKKIQDARNTLERPVVEDPGFERGSRFWCYFCMEEIQKHLTLDVCALKYGGLLEHIASLEHKKKMYSFFFDNKVDETQRHPDQFILNTDLLNKYKELAEKHIRQFEAVKKKRLSEHKSHINASEVDRRQVLVMHDGKSEMKISEITHNAPVMQTTLVTAENKATFMAQGEGLTFIGSHDYREGEGNIHTGATPPWLQGEERCSYGGQIGPTAEAYQKHLQQERKRKLLPATRVGARFDRSDMSQEWLPLFGRVWSKGRRLQSKQYFERKVLGTKKKQKHKLTTMDDRRHLETQSAVTEHLPPSSTETLQNSSRESSHQPTASVPKHVRPYVKKGSNSVSSGIQGSVPHTGSPLYVPLLLPMPVMKSASRKSCTVTTVNGEVPGGDRTVPGGDNSVPGGDNSVSGGDNSVSGATSSNSEIVPKDKYQCVSSPSVINNNAVETYRMLPSGLEKNIRPVNSYKSFQTFGDLTGEVHIKPYSRKRKLPQ